MSDWCETNQNIGFLWTKCLVHCGGRVICANIEPSIVLTWFLLRFKCAPCQIIEKNIDIDWVDWRIEINNKQCMLQWLGISWIIWRWHRGRSSHGHDTGSINSVRDNKSICLWESEREREREREREKTTNRTVKDTSAIPYLLKGFFSWTDDVYTNRVCVALLLLVQCRAVTKTVEIWANVEECINS